MQARVARSSPAHLYSATRASIDRRRFLALVGAGLASGGLDVPTLAASLRKEDGSMDVALDGTPRLDLETEYLFRRRTRVRRASVDV